MTDTEISRLAGLSTHEVAKARKHLGLEANKHEPAVPSHVYDNRRRPSHLQAVS